MNCAVVFLSDVSVTDSVTADSGDELSLLSVDSSQKSFAGRMVSTPLPDHPAAIDISDVISSIRGQSSAELCMSFL